VSFAAPWAAALAGVVLAAALCCEALARRRRGALRLPTFSALGRAGRRAWLARLHWPVRLALFALLLVALARPQYGYQVEEERRKGIDIIIALDTSESMRAADMRPSRLEAAKRVTKQFLARLENDRVGLVVFSGASYTDCPLTFDYRTVAEHVDQLTTDVVYEEGTAIGEAIANAVYRFDYSKKRTRVVILVTDGEQTVGGLSPLDGARVAEAKGVRVYTIGVGSRRGTVIARGIPIYTRLDEETLKNIAALTGGRYFHAGTAGELSTVFDEIQKLEKTEVKVRQLKRYREAMAPFVAGGVLLLLADIVLFGAWLRVLR